MATLNLGRVKGDPCSFYAECSTASATVNKIATVVQTEGETFILKKGVGVSVYFTNANTATNPTLNVNGTGNKSIYYKNSNVEETLITSGIYDFIYDGSYWLLKNSISQTKIDTMIGATKSEAGVGGITPAPQSGEQDKFLKGDGTWSDISLDKIKKGDTTAEQWIDNRLAGCWISFTDAEGKPTTKPYIHWNEEVGETT